MCYTKTQRLPGHMESFGLPGAKRNQAENHAGIAVGEPWIFQLMKLYIIQQDLWATEGL